MENKTPAKREYRKQFIPLESNPDVFTELVHKLGISDSLCFQDVLSLENSELLAFLPRPAYALVLVFPAAEKHEKRRAWESEHVEAYDGAGEGEDVVFFKQTIHNACGLYALLHAVCNGEARKLIGRCSHLNSYLYKADVRIEPGSILARLLNKCVPLKPEDRALALEDSAELESAYASVASKGETTAPAAEDEVDFHYVAFVESHQNGHLYQLDGDRRQPVDLGDVASAEDVLADSCLGVIRDMVVDEGGDMHFSLMALVPA